VHKLRYRKLIGGLACALMIGCQTVHPPNQSQPANQAPGQAQGQGTQARSQGQSQAPSIAQSISQSPALTAVAKATKTSAARLESTIATNVTHPIARFLGSLGGARGKLMREDFQPTELGAIVLAGIIIVGGAAWVITARRVSATRGRRV